MDVPFELAHPGCPTAQLTDCRLQPGDTSWSSSLELAKSVLNGIDADHLDAHRADIRLIIQVLDRLAP